MKKLLCIIPVVLLSLTTVKSGYGIDRQLQFYMGQFLIVATKVTGADPRAEAPAVSRKASKQELYRINRSLSGKKISGKGSCELFGRDYTVAFQDVELRLISAYEGLTAVSGHAKVTPDPDQQKTIRYTFDGFPVVIRTNTILLTPQYAQATVDISIPSQLLGAQGIANFNLSSTDATLSANGSVYGTDFKAETGFSFTPKDAFYTFEVDTATAHTVNIGNIIDGEKGVTLKGSASRGELSFSYTAHLKAEPKEAAYTLILSETRTQKPECGYELTLKEGRITHQYAERLVTAVQQLSTASVRSVPLTASPISVAEPSLTLVTRPALAKTMELIHCEGAFLCDLTLPETAPSETGQRIVLTDIRLETDRTGNLFGRVAVPTFVAGETFKIACHGDNAWLFFDNWAEGPRHYPCDTSGIIADFERFCQKYLYSVFEEADYLSRPGLTVFHGEFIFSPPQAVEIGRLHTKFWGDLTITPVGVTGTLTSGGYSLVPDDLASRVIQYEPPISSLLRIIESGDTSPEEPSELFRLADLRIMEMTIDTITFCANRIDSSLLKYDVHFPFPSHVGLEFVDESLDDDGIFHRAKGPVIRQAFQITESGPTKPQEGTYDVEGRILWFWRLPVVLFPEGVVISHRIASGSKTDVTIENADLGIPRLVSDEPLSPSLIPVDRQGVAFTGKFEPEGMFLLGAYQRDNWFGREKINSLECELKQITLADISESPASRRRDLEWQGEIDFPFYDVEEVEFDVRNAKCELKAPLVLDESHPHVLNPTKTLRADTQNTGLQYAFDKGAFWAPGARYRLIEGGQEGPWKNAVLWMHSFISAYLMDTDPPPAEPINISDTGITDQCGRRKRVVQQIANPVYDAPDLVCHDPEAHDERNDRYGEETCVPTIKGTYQVVSIDHSTPGEKETIVLNAPNATYYDLQHPLLTVDNADAELMTDDSPGSQGEAFSLSIPGAQFYVNTSTGDIEGVLSVSTNIGVSLPVEGSANFLFAINAACGHFFIYGDMYIEYFIGMGGQLLISHIPFARLNTMTIGAQGPIDRMADWAYVSKSTFIDECFGRLDLSTGTVTGALVAARVSFDIGFAGLGLGSGLWYFQSPPAEILGTYITAVAYVDLIVLQAAISGHLETDFQPDQEEIRAKGVIWGCVCVSAFIGHAQAEIETGIWFSNVSGVGLDSPDPDFELGWGGCECI